MTNEIESLKKQIEDLHDIIKKQNELITKTGKNVLELQIEKQRADVKSFGTPKNSSQGGFDSTDFATNDDLVELVGELQGELSLIEERSIRRSVNSIKIKPEDILAPLPNADGDIPSIKDDFFPTTLKEFENLADIKLFRLAKFYERLPPSAKEQENLEKYLDGKMEAMHVSDLTDSDIEKELKHYTKVQIDDIYNEVARYLGLHARRGTDVW